LDGIKTKNKIVIKVKSIKITLRKIEKVKQAQRIKKINILKIETKTTKYEKLKIKI
jgi:hypothetical protein